MKDIENRNDVELLVDTFYKKILIDSEMIPILKTLFIIGTHMWFEFITFGKTGFSRQAPIMGV